MNVFLLVCSFIFGIHFCFADDENPTVKSIALAESGGVFLDDKAQTLAGLQTLTLVSVIRHAEFTAYGKVVSIQPLLELRRRYLLAITEQSAAEARFKEAEQSINRLQELYREGGNLKT